MKKMTKKKNAFTPQELADLKLFKQMYAAHLFAEKNGCVLEDYKPLGNIFGDGEEYALTVFTKKSATC